MTRQGGGATDSSSETFVILWGQVREMGGMGENQLKNDSKLDKGK